MKIVLSPAKLMDISFRTYALEDSVPKFIEEASFIQKHMKEKSPIEIKKMMNISDKLANENWERNQAWNKNPTKKKSTQALFAFTGEVYRGLSAKEMNEKSIKFLQKNLIILSGLYGLLRPSDIIMQYRLEMGCKFNFEYYKNLYDFWKNKISIEINKCLGNDDFILNLASKEYFKVIDRKNIKSQIIDFDFYERRDDGSKNIVIYTKRARGLVTRFCAENGIEKLEDVKAFNMEGYLFDDKLSTENHFIFIR